MSILQDRWMLSADYDAAKEADLLLAHFVLVMQAVEGRGPFKFKVQAAVDSLALFGVQRKE
jgi:hypothetical protein